MESLREARPSFGRREGQEALVEAISEVISGTRGNYLIAKAGTGTGKSLASVIPALGYLRESGRIDPVVVSTATRNLQGQYFHKDLPLMAPHFPALNGRPAGFTFTVLKGKSNYVCLSKLENPEGGVSRLSEIRKFFKQVAVTGEVGELPFPVPPREARAITTSAEQCPGASNCLFGRECFYEKAKIRASKSDVVVINHALLAIDAKIREKTQGMVTLLPKPGVLVVDECHKLPGYVQNALSWSFAKNHLYKFANELIEYSDGSFEQFKKCADELFALVRHVRDSEPQHIVERSIFTHARMIQRLREIADEAMEYWISEARDAGDDRARSGTAWRKAARCVNLMEYFDLMVAPTPNDNFWTEYHQVNETVLHYKPKHVQDWMRHHLWMEPSEDGPPVDRSPVVLMSATTGEQPKSLYGLPEMSAHTYSALSPFDYRKNCRVFVPSLSGQPVRGEEKEWARKRNATILRLVEASGGRALLLFTSWKDLNETHNALAPVFSQHVRVFKQDRDNEAERDRLAKQFKDDETSVLFGTESFFEGIDVPGDSLRLVVISKLPFPSMYDATRGGKLDFNNEMMPEMKLKLEQAAGRLIRSATDRGLIAILDDRLLTKGYGKVLMRTVSPLNKAPLIRTLREATEYLESLDE